MTVTHQPPAHPAFRRTLLILAGAAMFVLSPSIATQGQPADGPLQARAGFLEIARDPDASAEQKRTVAAMMGFARETDPAKAYAKLKESDVLALYGGGADGLSDLSPLSDLTGLKTLVLFNHRITDLRPLEPLENLETLRLECNRIRDISPLAKLRNLRSLQITDNQISDLRPLAQLTRLETLWLSNNRINDITALRGLDALRDLHLSGNRVTDLRIFSELAVSTLRLADNGISDISALRDMNQETTGFIALDLSNNAIRDITPLGGLERLSSLDLSDNRVANVAALRNPALRWLDLEGNRITRVPDFCGLELTHVNLKRNPITDYADLVSQKKENPGLDIAADRKFRIAFERSFPANKELEGSPLLGGWRTDAFDSEWGNIVLEMEFMNNGIVYQRILPADPEDGEGFSDDGRFSLRGNLLVMTVRRDTSERRFEIKGNVLVLEEGDTWISYKRVGK